jgi:hypothetical protein
LTLCHFIIIQYFESILVNGVSGAFVIPHHSSKTCILAALTMTSHMLGYTSINIKTQLVFYTLLVTSFRLSNLQDPYSLFENIGSRIVFGSYSQPQTAVGSGNKKVKYVANHPFCLSRDILQPFLFPQPVLLQDSSDNIFEYNQPTNFNRQVFNVCTSFSQILTLTVKVVKT